MKSIIKLGMMAIFAMVLASSNIANADVVLTDEFNYADGELPAPWINHSGTGGQTIISNQNFMDDDGTGDYHRLFGSAITTGSIFAGFDLNVSAADPPTGSQYFAHFAELPSGAGANFASRVFLDSPAGAGDFDIGIRRGSGTGATTSYVAGTFFSGTTYRVVHGYDLATNTASLSIDSASGVPSVTDNTGTTDPAQLTLFGFRNGGGSAGDKTVDNLIVATTYGEAFTAAVPEPGSLSVLALIGLVGLTNRRRK